MTSHEEMSVMPREPILSSEMRITLVTVVIPTSAPDGADPYNNKRIASAVYYPGALARLREFESSFEDMMPQERVLSAPLIRLGNSDSERWKVSSARY
ncbi:hypothetical protein N7475_002512 [Penicillium sp. IBT 31633x]|nr:hypothetical protein N7475_002512 [Penicillium sp. IBT 31633x]